VGELSNGPVRYPDFAPLILAAGASSRMGRPKDLLQFEGVTALDLALRNCRDAGCGAPIVVTRTERAAEIRALLARDHAAADVVVNPSPELGQTSSLRIALQALAAKTRAFLVFPVDFPLVRASDVEELCRIFDRPEQYSSMEPDNGQRDPDRVPHPPRSGSGGQSPPAPPRNGQRDPDRVPHPPRSGSGGQSPPAPRTPDVVVPSFARRRGHPVLVNAALAPRILQLPPEAPARDVLSAPDLYTIYMEVDDDRVLVDMDTPEAYLSALARYRARE
jgi:CTP:molybdopterin cytidylyltransferase MocA